MNAIDWLPTRPLSIAECTVLNRTDDEIDLVIPVFGIEPDPQQAVIACFIGRQSDVLSVAYYPTVRAWVALEQGKPADQVGKGMMVADGVHEFVEEMYPGQDIGLMAPPLTSD